MSQHRTAEVSEAEIAVHWQEEGYGADHGRLTAKGQGEPCGLLPAGRFRPTGPLAPSRMSEGLPCTHVSGHVRPKATFSQFSGISETARLSAERTITV
jgi:hypothetical protein